MSDFIKASRIKLRFATNKGELSVEDLWDLSLESLDQIAVNVDKQIETSGTKSFIGKRNTKNAELELALEILKYVIEVKLQEKEAKAKRAERNAQLAQLKELANAKAGEELQGKSREEILQMIADMEKED